MAAGEEDYMGDISQFLPPESSQLSSKECSGTKPVVLNSSNKKSKAQKLLEQRRLKSQWKQIDEDQQTMENLDLAIPESNIGFKLLKRMGYTPGLGLGMEGSGIAKPLGLEIRRGRAGIGREDPKVENIKRAKHSAEIRKRKEDELMEDFGSRQKERWNGRWIVQNYRKAEDVLAQLEKKDFEVENIGDEDGENEGLEEEEITDEDLLNVLLKLRNEFHYCLFCGYRYESTEALMSGCPGIKEDEH